MCQHTWGGAFIILKLVVKANGSLEKMSSCFGFLVKESIGQLCLAKYIAEILSLEPAKSFRETFFIVNFSH